MSIAYRVQDYIAERKLLWDPVPHGRSDSCIDAALLAEVPPENVAKAVVLKDHGGYLLAVIPASTHLDLAGLRTALGRNLRPASEAELRAIFPDCARGAIPPVGAAYAMPTVWLKSLGDARDVYFEGGDHRTLVHMTGPDFGELMRSARALPKQVLH